MWETRGFIGKPGAGKAKTVSKNRGEIDCQRLGATEVSPTDEHRTRRDGSGREVRRGRQGRREKASGQGRRDMQV